MRTVDPTGRRALTRCSSTELEMRAPSSITHSMPMDTLGPILQSRPILAVVCRITLPSISGPCASCSGALRRSDARCSCSPAVTGHAAGSEFRVWLKQRRVRLQPCRNRACSWFRVYGVAAATPCAAAALPQQGMQLAAQLLSRIVISECSLVTSLVPAAPARCAAVLPGAAAGMP